MITTAVQHTPQVIEVQGAPAEVQGSSDSFRATFAASVGGAATQSGTGVPDGGSPHALGAGGSGTEVAKQLLTAGTALKSAPLTEVAQGKSAANALVAKIRVSQRTTAATRSPATGGKSDSTLKGVTGTETVPASAGDLGGAALPIASTQVSEGGSARGAEVDSKNSQSELAVGPLATLPPEVKPAGSGSSEEGSGVRARKGEATASNKTASEAEKGTVQAAISGGMVPPAQGPSHANAAIVPSALPPSSAVQLDLASSPLSSPVTRVDAAAAPQQSKRVEAPPDGTATSQILAGAIDSKDTTSNRSGVAAALAGLAAVPTVAGPARSIEDASVSRYPSVSKALRGAESVGTSARVSVAGRDPFHPIAAVPTTTSSTAAIGADQKPQVEDVFSLSKSVLSNSVDKVDVVSKAPASTSQSRAIALPQPGVVSPLRLSAQPVTSEAAGGLTGQESGTAQRSPGVDLKADAAVAAQGSLLAAPAQGESMGTQALNAGRESALAAAPVAGAASHVIAKLEKAKPTAVASADGAATQPASLVATGNLTSEAANSSATVPIGVAATVPAATSASVAVVHAAMPALWNTSLPAAGASASRGAATHALSETIKGPSSESIASSSTLGESHRTLVATPTALEVGVQSGTQGWLRIRAEVGGQGEVNASVAAASSGAREALHSQMPALNAFLHSEQMAVTTTVVGQGGSLAGQSQGAAMGAGGGESQERSGGFNSSFLQGGGPQGDGGQRGPQQPSVSAVERLSGYDVRAGVSDPPGLSSSRTSSNEESGRWLNVRV